MCSEQSNGESGIVIIILTTGLFVLLVINGLALDAGNLYRAQLALQKSADAAGLAGVQYSSSRGWLQFNKDVKEFNHSTSLDANPKEDIEKFMKPKAEQIVRANMAGSGYPHTAALPVNVDIEFQTVPDPVGFPDAAFTYRVTVSRVVDFLLIDAFLPDVGKGKQLSASATVVRRVANVVVLLDVSDSMNCPAAGDCSCLTPARGTGASACPANGRKMDRLIEAMKVFVKMFDLAKDRLYVVPFNVAAEAVTLALYAQAVSLNMLPPLDQLTEAHIDEFIEMVDDFHDPKGATNFCDALMQARQLMKDQGVYGQKDISYLLFSDGAPTAGRFLFADAPNLPLWPPGYGTRDYVHWTVQWIDRSDGLNRAGPSLLVQNGLIEMDHTTGSPPIASAAGPQWASCSMASATEPLRPVGAATSSVADIAAAVFSPCMNSLAAHLPDNTAYVYGADYGRSGGRAWSEWREQYYNCAIALADQLREARGLVYMIGTGTPAPISLAEDRDGDGNLDIDEDLDHDGRLDIDEDRDNDGHLDVEEDTNGNGRLNRREDRDGDGRLDHAEDADGDGRLDVAEDADGDGRLDTAETDHDGDGVADAVADPYQGVQNVHLRHDFFNARLANAQFRAVEVPLAQTPPWRHPENWGIGTNYKTYSQWANTPDRQGEYLASPDTRELTLLFEDMGRKILARLVQ